MLTAIYIYRQYNTVSHQRSILSVAQCRTPLDYNVVATVFPAARNYSVLAVGVDGYLYWWHNINGIPLQYK